MSWIQPAPGVSLANCDREPIHIPGSVQAHGCLLVLSLDEVGRLLVEQASRNTAFYLGQPAETILGSSCAGLLSNDLEEKLLGEFQRSGDSQANHFLGSFRFPTGCEMDVITHTINGKLVAELERTDSSLDQHVLNTTIVNVMAQLENLMEIRELGVTITREIRALTQFDRVLLYSFDEQGNATVLAEDRNDRLPPMLHLCFPSTDIPSQARRLYLLNRVRIIPDVEYTPHPILATSNIAEPLDLTYSVLRSVSPVHRDYMHNMGTAASMSISIVIDGKLWGMVSCHNAVPRTVPYVVRSCCDVLTRIVATQISAHSRGRDYAEAIRLKAIERDLLTYMALEEKYLDGITNHPEKVMQLTNATGAAFILDDTCVLMGETPSEQQVKSLADSLATREPSDIFASSNLLREFPAAEEFTDTASGMIAVSLSQVHRFQILWFRSEILRTVHWAGAPHKDPEANGRLDIGPSRSFATWSELVRGQSAPWTHVEIEAARDFRNAVLSIVLRRAEELADIAAELEFTNKELEAFSYSVSHDLRAPFRHISGFAELLLTDESERLTERGKGYLNRISQAAQFAGQLVDSLLNFSQIARTRLDLRPISLEALVHEVWNDVIAEELQGRTVQFHCAELPMVEGDAQLLRQALRNLLSNAAKYSRTRPVARVDVNATRDHHQFIFSVRDNGVGFDNRYVHKLFGAFQRLHRMEDFEGTGIGLANVRRIITRHGGQTWAEGKLDEGATFYFSLPVPESAGDRI
jgi:light-regulated signal transduction histidine kinase (bacteriophytochrome)